MLGFYLISFEVVVIVLYGIFMRTDTSSIDNIDLFSQSCMLLLGTAHTILGFTLYSLNYRKFDWTTLGNLLFVVAVSFQWNALFYAFWTSCLNRSFSSTTSLSMLGLMSSVQAVLCVLVTVAPFLARMSHTQVFLVCIIEVIGYSLNFVVEILGIKAVTCGGGMTIFLFAAVFGFFIKLFNFPQQRHEPDSNYTNGTLKLIGLVLMVFSWAGFNSMGTLFDTANVSSTANLSPSAYFNTLLCLSSAIICSLTVQSFGNRINMHKLCEAVFNSGILISSCASLIIDPFAGLLLGICGTLLTALYERYGQKAFFRGDPLHVLFASILSGLLSGIFAAGRASRSPTLSTDTYKLGGLQIACLVVSFGFAAIFGLIAAGFLRLTKGVKDTEIGQDQAFWVINPDMLPLYASERYTTKREPPKEMEFELRSNPAHVGGSILK